MWDCFYFNWHMVEFFSLFLLNPFPMANYKSRLAVARENSLKFFNPYIALGFRNERQKTNKDKHSHDWTIFNYHQSNERQFIKWMTCPTTGVTVPDCVKQAGAKAEILWLGAEILMQYMVQVFFSGKIAGFDNWF